MQPALKVSPIGDMVWVNGKPFPFEIVKAFAEEAEKLRNTHPQALRAVLVAARNREGLAHHAGEFPAAHAWHTSALSQATALVLAPAFYRIKLGESAAGRVVHNEQLDRSVRFDMQTHREILRLIFEGVF